MKASGIGEARERALILRFYPDSQRIGKEVLDQNDSIVPNAEHMTIVATTGLAGEQEILPRNYFLIALTQECVLVAQNLHKEIDILRLEVFICTQVKSNRLQCRFVRTMDHRFGPLRFIWCCLIDRQLEVGNANPLGEQQQVFEVGQVATGNTGKCGCRYTSFLNGELVYLALITHPLH